MRPANPGVKRNRDKSEEDSVSRRRLLRSAGATAVGAVATGIFLRNASDATATEPHDYQILRVGTLEGHIVSVTNAWAGPAELSFFTVVNQATSGSVAVIRGESQSPDGIGILGQKLGTASFGGAGVKGVNAKGNGVVGESQGGGTGVVGDGTYGVLGRSSTAGGIGVWGQHFGIGPALVGHNVSSAASAGPGIHAKSE